MKVDLVPFAIVLLILAASANAQEAPRRVRLGSPVTHSDWMLRDPAPEWGLQGVRQILDRCKECGWSRVYWRCFDGGRALYPSKLMDPAHGYDEDNYHKTHGSTWVLDKLAPYNWGEFDSLAEAVRYGHEIGLEVHAWLTINEDDHGWGLQSRFNREHPESRWTRRDGSRYRSQQSFAFPQVREYKLALVRELLAYKPDGIFFDWIRTGDVRCNPQTDPDGVANHGYEEPNIAEFKRLYGIDPHEVPNGDDRWVAVRAKPQTQFMRMAKQAIEEADPDCVISVMVHNPWGYRGAPNDTPYDGSLRGLLLDVQTWAGEGLMDEAVAAGYYRPGGNAELTYNWLKEQTLGKCDLWLFGWNGSVEGFRNDTALAERLGAAELLLWESDYIELPPKNADRVKAMSDYAAGR